MGPSIIILLFQSVTLIPICFLLTYSESMKLFQFLSFVFIGVMRGTASGLSTLAGKVHNMNEKYENVQSSNFEIEIEDSESINVKHVVTRALASASSSDRTFYGSSEFITIAIPKIVGHESFQFSLVGETETGVGDDNIILNTKATSKNKYIRLQLSFQKGTKSVTFIVTIGSNIPKKEVTKIIAVLEKQLKSRLPEQIRLLEIRRRNLVQETILSKAESKLAKVRKLDKLINPEKYKNTSPTVRRVKVSTGKKHKEVSPIEKVSNVQGDAGKKLSATLGSKELEAVRKAKHHKLNSNRSLKGSGKKSGYCNINA